jgi:hypothetical protein
MPGCIVIRDEPSGKSWAGWQLAGFRDIRKPLARQCHAAKCK